MKKLFVGNLAWKVTEDSLKELFGRVGNVVSVKIVVDQYTGKSRGFGFVEMETSEDANRAIKELDNQPMLDRNLRVSLAQERSDRPQQSGGGNREFRQNSNYGEGNQRSSFRPRSGNNGRSAY